MRSPRRALKANHKRDALRELEADLPGMMLLNDQDAFMQTFLTAPARLKITQNPMT